MQIRLDSSSPRARWSQSAVELSSLPPCDDDLTMLQPVPSTAMAALATSTTTATTTGSPRATRAPPSPSRKSKLPAFLTPPLMRKRKHILDANFSTSLPSTTQSATASPSHKGSGGKSPGFFSLLKVSAFFLFFFFFTDYQFFHFIYKSIVLWLTPT